MGDCQQKPIELNYIGSSVSVDTQLSSTIGDEISTETLLTSIIGD